MPDPHIDEWKRLVAESSRAHRLSPEVVDELATHIADFYASELEAGRTPGEAKAAALRELERGAYREVAGRRRASLPASRLIARAPQAVARWWNDLMFDLRYAVRGMRRQRAFTAAIVVILAAGIGATTASYAVIDAALLRRLPYPDAAQLVVFKNVTPKGEGRAFSAADWRDFAARHAPSVTLAAYASWPMNLTGGGEPERLQSVIVSGDFFAVAGVRPLLGRLTTTDDDTAAAPPVVVLSHAFWSRRFGGSASVVGTQVTLNGRSATVVGVMPADFVLPSRDVDLWMPMGLAPDVLADRAGEWMSLVGRLRPDVTVERLQSDLTVTSSHLAAQFPRTNADERAVARPLLDEVVRDVRRPLWLGGLAALFVLLAGCANAANLMVARATIRRDEIAIRSALGADPMRLARQLLVESGVLAAVGGAAGIGAAALFLRAFVALANGRVPRVDALQLNITALVVALGLAMTTALIFGGAASWLLVRTRATGRTRADSPRTTRSSRLGNALLAAQVSLAMMLLAGATVVVRSYVSTARIDPGFDVTDTMTLQLTLPRTRYPDNAAHVRFVERVRAEILRLPGVASAGVVSDLPFVGNATSFRVATEDEAAADGRRVAVRLADDGFFETLRIRVLTGRGFTAGDRSGAAPVAIVNHTAVQRGFDPGKRIQVSGDVVRTIVGVVGDIRHAGLQTAEGPVVYVPYAQKPFAFLNWIGVVARGQGLTPSAASLKGAIASVDALQPAHAARSMAEYVDRNTAPFRFSSLVVGSLAAVATILALTGIYGLTAFVVGRRTREIGLRLALGATRVSVVVMVLRQIGLTLIAGGVIGVGGSILTNRALAAAVGGADTSASPVALVTSAAVLALTAGMSALGPALRAARIDPRETLQAE